MFKCYVTDMTVCISPLTSLKPMVIRS